ncbi:hypothetical protein GC167_06210 [bacterium]|nr:hypothetical protein [bacterium]
MSTPSRTTPLVGQSTGFWNPVLDQVRIVANGVALVLWTVMILWLIIEIKQYYNIDFFPGFDTPVDETQNSLSRWVRDAMQW